LKFISVFVLLALLLSAGAGVLTACSPPTLTADPTPTPPTEAPTLAPPPTTSTPATPPSFYATQEAARQATIVARATTSPFPTAEPAAVRTGRPATAVARRDGLSFLVRLPKDDYLAGEGGQAEITLRNDGPETVFIHGDGQHLAWMVLLDERGHEPAPWPWPPMILPAPPYLRQLAPGEVLTETLTFQVPPVEQAAGHSYVLWAATRFSRPQPDQPIGPDNLWLHLETGPIPLRVTLPAPAQRLVADLQADRDGWRLRVTDAEGNVPAGPLWGFWEAASPDSAAAGLLQDNPDGTWSGAWDIHTRGEEIVLRAWVAAPGYVTAAVTRTVPGTGDAGRMLGTWEPPAHQTFTSLAEAQAALDFPLYQPGRLPPGAALDAVRVESRADRDRRWVDVHQTHRLPGGDWLELTQMIMTGQNGVAGWGRARYAPEARPVAVGENIGYAVLQFGWWALDWKAGDVGFELRAPAQAFSLEDLLSIAASIEPLR